MHLQRHQDTSGSSPDLHLTTTLDQQANKPKNHLEVFEPEKLRVLVGLCHSGELQAFLHLNPNIISCSESRFL